MTALTSHQISATSVDRALLRAASALDRLVEARLARRAASLPAGDTAEHDSARATAQALGSMGIMPR